MPIVKLSQVVIAEFHTLATKPCTVSLICHEYIAYLAIRAGLFLGGLNGYLKTRYTHTCKQKSDGNIGFLSIFITNILTFHLNFDMLIGLNTKKREVRWINPL